MSSDGPLKRILDRLEDAGGRSGHYKTLCTAHDNHDSSLGASAVEGETGEGRAYQDGVQTRRGAGRAARSPHARAPPAVEGLNG